MVISFGLQNEYYLCSSTGHFGSAAYQSKLGTNYRKYYHTNECFHNSSLITHGYDSERHCYSVCYSEVRLQGGVDTKTSRTILSDKSRGRCLLIVHILSQLLLLFVRQWCNFRSQQFKFLMFGKKHVLRVAVLSAFGRANNLIQWIKNVSVLLNILGINRQPVLKSGVFKSFKSFLLIMLLLKAGLADGIRIANEIENILNPWLSIEQYLVLNTQTMIPGIRDKCLPSVPKPACDANKLNCQRHVRHAHSKLDSSSAYPNLYRNDCASFLYGSHKDCICHASKGTQRIAALRKYKLFHCYNYNLWDVLDNKAKKGILEDSDLCLRYLSAIEALDATAGSLVCEFEELMARYDCSQTFSTMSNCDQCKAAYRLWTCSMFLPYWADAVPVKPCRSFCHQVERLCPYFLPADKTGPGSQYAGEPSYMCIDNDVLETSSQAVSSAYSAGGTCYRPCTLDYTLEPNTSPIFCRSFDTKECSDISNSTCLPIDSSAKSLSSRNYYVFYPLVMFILVHYRYVGLR